MEKEEKKRAYKARICREMPDTVDKHEWKADVCAFVESAFSSAPGETEYEIIAATIQIALDAKYGKDRWVVFVYEPGGDTSVWYQSGYCCTAECKETSSGSLRYVALKYYPNLGKMSIKLEAKSDLGDGSAHVTESGTENTKEVMACLSGLLGPNPAGLDVIMVQDAFANEGWKHHLGYDWGVCKCRRGAVVCALVSKEYVAFQYKDFVYFCFRQR